MYMCHWLLAECASLTYLSFDAGPCHCQLPQRLLAQRQQTGPEAKVGYGAEGQIETLQRCGMKHVPQSCAPAPCWSIRVLNLSQKARHNEAGSASNAIQRAPVAMFIFTSKTLHGSVPSTCHQINCKPKHKAQQLHGASSPAAAHPQQPQNVWDHEQAGSPSSEMLHVARDSSCRHCRWGKIARPSLLMSVPETSRYSRQVRLLRVRMPSSPACTQNRWVCGADEAFHKLPKTYLSCVLGISTAQKEGMGKRQA